MFGCGKMTPSFKTSYDGPLRWGYRWGVCGNRKIEKTAGESTAAAASDSSFMPYIYWQASRN